VKVKLGSPAEVEDAHIGDGIGLDNHPQVVEFAADWEKLRFAPVGDYLEVED